MNRVDFAKLEHEPLDAAPKAGHGEAVFRLSRFALTFNNITYASYGDALGYWRFFPVDAARGLLPVWGYADAAESNAPGIEPGQRYYGYWPLATHALLRPGRIHAHSFRDDASHRAELPEIYNWYQRTDDDPFHGPTSEPLHAIYRPLFITAFCLADFLVDNDLFGAAQIIVSSASSKTAYATAFCLEHSANDRRPVRRVGLTGDHHLDFVRGLDLYDDAVAYDELETLDPHAVTLYVDIAGNPALKHQVHQHFGEQLAFDSSVGAAQSLTPPEPERDLPGPKPEFFFAPSWIAKRHADWGVAGFNQRAGEATAAFYRYVMGHKLVEVVNRHGLEAAGEIIVDMVEGRTDPRVGHVISLD